MNEQLVLTQYKEEAFPLAECDCSTTEKVRHKDLRYDSQAGERTVTVWIEFCPVCGDFKGVE